MKLRDLIITNARKPKGFWGRVMIGTMNRGHAQLTAWALSHWRMDSEDTILDIGCGGGKALAWISAQLTQAQLYGLDYSETSVQCARKENEKDIQSAKMHIEQGSVSRLPYDDRFFDRVLSIESYYFWPDLSRDMQEVFRVLRPGGSFMLAAEMYQDGNNTHRQERIEQKLQMNNLTPEEFRQLFERTGYRNVDIHFKKDAGWICVLGTK